MLPSVEAGSIDRKGARRPHRMARNIRRSGARDKPALRIAFPRPKP